MQLCQGNLWIGQMLDDMGCEDNVKRVIRVGQTNKTGAPEFECCLRMLKARLRLLEHSLGYVDRIHVKGARKLLTQCKRRGPRSDASIEDTQGDRVLPILRILHDP